MPPATGSGTSDQFPGGPAVPAAASVRRSSGLRRVTPHGRPAVGVPPCWRVAPGCSCPGAGVVAVCDRLVSRDVRVGVVALEDGIDQDGLRVAGGRGPVADLAGFQPLAEPDRAVAGRADPGRAFGRNVGALALPAVEVGDAGAGQRREVLDREAGLLAQEPQLPGIQPVVGPVRPWIVPGNIVMASGSGAPSGRP